jgi:hypothetical protein
MQSFLGTESVVKGIASAPSEKRANEDIEMKDQLV